MIYVAAAGPGMNMLLAFISLVLLKGLHVFILPSPFDPVGPSLIQQLIVEALLFSAYLNVLLAVFNMLPIPPLDGGRVLVGLLPPSWARYFAPFEFFGIFILLAILFLLPMLSQSLLGHPISLFQQFLLPVVQGVTNFMAELVGL